MSIITNGMGEESLIVTRGMRSGFTFTRIVRVFKKIVVKVFKYAGC